MPGQPEAVRRGCWGRGRRRRLGGHHGDFLSDEKPERNVRHRSARRGVVNADAGAATRTASPDYADIGTSAARPVRREALGVGIKRMSA